MWLKGSDLLSSKFMCLDFLDIISTTSFAGEQKCRQIKRKNGKTQPTWQQLLLKVPFYKVMTNFTKSIFPIQVWIARLSGDVLKRWYMKQGNGNGNWKNVDRVRVFRPSIEQNWEEEKFYNTKSKLYSYKVTWFVYDIFRIYCRASPVPGREHIFKALKPDDNLCYMLKYWKQKWTARNF